MILAGLPKLFSRQNVSFDKCYGHLIGGTIDIGTNYQKCQSGKIITFAWRWWQDIKHCEGLYDTKCFKSLDSLHVNGELRQLIWEIRRLPLYPEDVQCIPLDNPDY